MSSFLSGIQFVVQEAANVAPVRGLMSSLHEYFVSKPKVFATIKILILFSPKYLLSFKELKEQVYFPNHHQH